MEVALFMRTRSWIILSLSAALVLCAVIWVRLVSTTQPRDSVRPPIGPVDGAAMAEGRGAYRHVMGWQSVDLRKADFAAVSTEQMWSLTFDTRTRWPAVLPTGFDPKAALEAGKDPGLGLRKLHQQGITGKGVAVAVIDNPMATGHREFEDRLSYTMIDPTHQNAKWIHFHGAATASILAGKSVGVAPGAFVYYYAVPGSLADFSQISQAIDQILLHNQTAVPERRVRVISISMGIDNPVFKDAMARAEAAGVAVVHCGNWFPVRYRVAGSRPDLDRSLPESYDTAAASIRGRLYADMLYVPADFRTTASSEGKAVYAYWGEGGASWAAPWLAGLITLGMQVNPSLTPAEAYSAIAETASVGADGVRVPNPEAFIAKVRQ